MVAHQLLSFKNKEWQLGNHLGETVKGKQYKIYPPEVQKGILLHRLIDSFTDHHPLVIESCKLLHPNHGKYAGIVVDIFYDYLLIKNWSRFSAQNFDDFVKDCYQIFEKGIAIFPPKLQFLTRAMIRHDWFHKYGTMEGVEMTLKELSKKTKFENNMHAAVKDLYIFEKEIENDFLQFFPELNAKCASFLGLEGF